MRCGCNCVRSPLRGRLAVYLVLAAISACTVGSTMAADLIELPAPSVQGNRSLEATIAERRSVREFGRRALTLEELGQLLWAAQGITSDRGLRSAPSAGALYPLEVFAVVGRVRGLDSGVYRYTSQQHALAATGGGDRREALSRAAFGQPWLADAPAVIVLAGESARTARKYGSRAERYVAMEAGHAGQNVLLQANALSLEAVVVGAFADREVLEILDLSPSYTPFSLIPVGPSR